MRGHTAAGNEGRDPEPAKSSVSQRNPNGIATHTVTNDKSSKQ